MADRGAVIEPPYYPIVCPCGYAGSRGEFDGTVSTPPGIQSRAHPARAAPHGRGAPVRLRIARGPVVEGSRLRGRVPKRAAPAPGTGAESVYLDLPLLRCGGRALRCRATERERTPRGEARRQTRPGPRIGVGGGRGLGLPRLPGRALRGRAHLALLPPEFGGPGSRRQGGAGQAMEHGRRPSLHLWHRARRDRASPRARMGGGSARLHRSRQRRELRPEPDARIPCPEEGTGGRRRGRRGNGRQVAERLVPKGTLLLPCRYECGRLRAGARLVEAPGGGRSATGLSRSATPRRKAHRGALVHRSRSGLANSESGGQNQQHFFFGDWRVLVEVCDAEVRLPREVEEEKTKGRQVRASGHGGSIVSVRGLPAELHRRTDDEGAALLRAWERSRERSATRFTASLRREAPESGSAAPRSGLRCGWQSAMAGTAGPRIALRVD